MTLRYGNIPRGYSHALLIDFLNANPPVVRTFDVTSAAWGASVDATPAENTDAINTALVAASAAGGGDVVVPGIGTFLIDPTRNPVWSTFGGVQLQPGTRLIIEAGATLQAMDGIAAGAYSVVLVASGATDCAVLGGGTIDANRAGHSGTAGEQGYCVLVTDGAARVSIADLTLANAWGDGICLAPRDATLAASRPSDVTLTNLRSDHSRRNGCSITGAVRVTVAGCLFENATGTAPQAGIDLEADATNTPNEGISITNTICRNNVGQALSLGGFGNYGVRVGQSRFEASVGSYSLVAQTASDTAVFTACTFIGPVLYGYNCRFVGGSMRHDGTYTAVGYAISNAGDSPLWLDGVTVTATGGGRLFFLDGSTTAGTAKVLTNCSCEVAGNGLADLATAWAIAGAFTIDGGRLVHTGTNPATGYSANVTLSALSRIVGVQIDPVLARTFVSGVVSYDPAQDVIAHSTVQPGGVSADRGNAPFTLNVLNDQPLQRVTTTLTADRAVTVQTTSAYTGRSFDFFIANTGGFNWTIGGLFSLTGTNQRARLTFDGSAWVRTG